MKYKYHGVIILALMLVLDLYCQKLNVQGELSSWFGMNKIDSENKFYGIRYIPTLMYQKYLTAKQIFDLEISINAFHTGNFNTFDQMEYSQEVEAYRMWGRYSSSQFELRAGLQKINFGSATLFRPLMWFDSMDPRDPLQITSGVYALLLRYYFLNNANFWLWGLLGNQDPKGWEIHPTIKNQPEFGGRLQYPIFNGEVALAYHQRGMQLNEMLFPPEIFGKQTAEEYRLGLDGKWDIEIGFWLELAVSYQDNQLLPYAWRHLGNIGADYTLEIGNGLNILAEHFISEESSAAFSSGEGFAFSGATFSYPMGIIDQLDGIFYYDWEEEDYYRFLDWRRTYDRWTFFIMVFWNPNISRSYPNQSTVNNFAGKGFQLMVVFNH